MGHISQLNELSSPAGVDLILTQDFGEGTGASADAYKKLPLSSVGILSLAATWSAKQTFSAGISLGNETLSVYDEGTWTPTDASGAGLTLSATVGRYTRIGRLVYAEFTATYPTTANGSVATIGGVPFTPTSLTGSTAGGGVFVNINYTTERYFPLVTTSSTVIFVQHDGGGNLTNANLSSTVMRHAVIYVV